MIDRLKEYQDKNIYSILHQTIVSKDTKRCSIHCILLQFLFFLMKDGWVSIKSRKGMGVAVGEGEGEWEGDDYFTLKEILDRYGK